MDQPETIVVVTCDRTPSYLEGLLVSMTTDPNVKRVHLVVCGGSDPSYLDSWRDHPAADFVVVEPSMEDKEIAGDANPVQRTILTTARALELADGLHPVILFEDDAVCGKNWLERARAAAHKLEERHGDDFLLALYAAYCLPRDKRLVKYDPSNFYGNVGLWLAPKSAVKLGGMMRADVSERRFEACDMITKRMLWGGTPAFAHSPSIVNHMGDKSTRGHTYIIRAQSYLG